MLSQDFAVGPLEVDGAINIELGTVGLLLRKNEIVEVLGPGRYSRFRLAMMGIMPSSLAMFVIRTALTRFTADCYNVRLGGSIVDLRVVVQVRLRLGGDLKTFFHSLISTYGTDFATNAPIILQQLVAESLQETGGFPPTTSTRSLRSDVSRAMAPHEVFEIVDVVAITVTRDDPITVQAEVEERLRGLDRARRLSEIELAAEEGELRAAGVLQLSQRLGLDPMYLWDPNLYRDREQGQRDAMVQLLGQYGGNLAILAEATNMNLGMLGSLLAPVLPQTNSSEQESVAPTGNEMGVASSIRASLALEDTATDLVRQHRSHLLGGVARSTTVDGKTLEIVLVATSPEYLEAVADTLRTNISPGTIAGVFDGQQSASVLVREIAAWVTGMPHDAIQLSHDGGQVVWGVPESMAGEDTLAQFTVETICDLFMSPPVVPVLIH